MDFPIYFFRDLISDGMKSGPGPVFGGLVGYTNAGKSTVMNLLTDSKVYSKNELFATLDSTTRSMYIDSRQKVLISESRLFGGPNDV